MEAELNKYKSSEIYVLSISTNPTKLPARVRERRITGSTTQLAPLFWRF